MITKTNIASIDHDHEYILQQIDELQKLFDAAREMEYPRQIEVVSILIRDCGKHVTQHFREEEALMTKIGFPGLEAHRAIHQKVLDGYQQFIIDSLKVTKGEYLPLARAYFNQFRVEILSHMNREDQEWATSLIQD